MEAKKRPDRKEGMARPSMIRAVETESILEETLKGDLRELVNKPSIMP